MMNCKPSIPIPLTTEESDSSDSKCKNTSKDADGKSKRNKKLMKKNEWLDEKEAKMEKWNERLDSCLKQNIKIILRDQKHIQSLNKLDMGIFYKCFKDDTSLYNSVKLKVVFEGMIRSFNDEISSLEYRDHSGLNAEQRAIAMRLFDKDKDLEEHQIEIVDARIKDKIRIIRDKIEVIMFEIGIIDKIITRLNDKVHTSKSYSNKEMLDKSLIKVENLKNMKNYKELVQLSKDIDEKIWKNINSNGSILTDKNVSGVNYMQPK